MAERLRILMDLRGLEQIDVARAASVSQPTVSRALKRSYSRRTKSRKKLEDFVSLTEYGLHKRKKLPAEVAAAISVVWDKTDTHAHLIARVIRALEGLVPKVNVKEHAKQSIRD